MRKITLRLDDDTWAALRRLAESESRSMNAQISQIVRERAAAKGLFSTSRPTLVKTA